MLTGLALNVPPEAIRGPRVPGSNTSITSARPPRGADGEAAADDLAEGGQIRIPAVAALGPVVADAERDDLVEDEEDPVLPGELPEEREEPLRGRDEPHAVRQGVDEHRRQLGRVARHEPLAGVGVVPGQDQRLEHAVLGHAARGGHAGRRVVRAPVVGPRAVAHLDVVVVAVIRALELGDAVAARVGARRLDGHHHRLGAGVAEADPLEPGTRSTRSSARAVPPSGVDAAKAVPRASLPLTASTSGGKAWPWIERR